MSLAYQLHLCNHVNAQQQVVFHFSRKECWVYRSWKSGKQIEENVPGGPRMLKKSFRTDSKGNLSYFPSWKTQLEQRATISGFEHV